MMLQLLVMRHAKSDWEAGAADDHDRPLAARGVKAARRMGRLVSDLGVMPDLVRCSTAVRARQTVELAVEAGGWRCPVEPTRSFYDDDALGVVGEIGTTREVERLMVVGHEPAWSELVSVLIGGGRLRLPTAAIACIELDAAAWRGIGPGTGRLLWLVHPRLVTAVS